MRFRSAYHRPPYTQRAVTPYTGPDQVDKVSIIIPFGSVEYEPQLDGCLTTIRQQRHVPKDCFDIVLLLVSNKQDTLDSIVDLAEKHDARLITASKEYDHFPLALARNVGSKVAMSNTLCFIDADMLLDPEVIAQSLGSPGLYTVFSAYMPEQYPRNRLLCGSPEEFREAVALGEVNTSGYGGYLLIPRSTFEAVGGYDEAYDIGWGAEDNDFVDRVLEYGVTRGLRHYDLTTTKGIVNAHQWHQRVDHSKEPATITNRQRYMNLSTVVANAGVGWGQLRTTIAYPLPPPQPPPYAPSKPTVSPTTPKKRVPRKQRKFLTNERGLRALVERNQIRGDPPLSIIISCSSDRYAVRLLRCLHSIRGQIGVQHDDIEIVISAVHISGKPERTTRLKHIAEMYRAKLVEGDYYSDAYNLAFSRNFGAVNSKGYALCFLDADIILDPELIRFALAALTSHNHVVTLVAYMPRNVPESVYQSTNMEKFRSFTRRGELGERGYGGCIFMYRSAWSAVGGYDEEYVGWGGEDTDMCDRLTKAGCPQVNLTERHGVIVMHQWHSKDRKGKEITYRDRNWKRRFDTTLPLVRNSYGYGGVNSGITTMVPHHPLRPMRCLRKSLEALGKSVSARDHAVHLYIQGPCEEELPRSKDYPFELHITKYDRNMGLSVPTLDSIERFLSGRHQWWSKVDDDIIMPEDGLEQLIGVIEHEDRVGEINVGACQMTTGPGTWVHKPRVFVLSTEIVEGMPVLELEDGHVVDRKVGDVHWRVADASGWGSTVFHRRVFESGVRPDTRYFLGVVDIDVFYQMKMRGMRVALVDNPSCSQLVAECYNPAYRAIRYNKEVVRQSGRRFTEKWGVYHRKLVEYKK